MTYIITESCIGEKDKSCLDVGPVGCIRPCTLAWAEHTHCLSRWPCHLGCLSATRWVCLTPIAD